MALTKLKQKSRRLMISALEMQNILLMKQASDNTEADLKEYYKNAVQANMEAQEALEACKNTDIHIQFV